MTRYCKQRDNFSCGPMALLNVLKWLGEPVTQESHKKRLIKEMKSAVTPDTGLWGTWTRRFIPILQKHLRDKAAIRSKQCPSMREIKQATEDGQAIILLYRTKRGNGHYSLILPHQGKTFKFVNDSVTKPAIVHRHEATMKRRLRKKRLYGRKYPKAWFIKKS